MLPWLCRAFSQNALTHAAASAAAAAAAVPAAKKVLAKHRFAIHFNGHPAKLMYSALDKDRVYGPFSLKFQIIIKVKQQRESSCCLSYCAVHCGCRHCCC
jgi:hypothetical protein